MSENKASVWPQIFAILLSAAISAGAAIFAPMVSSHLNYKIQNDLKIAEERRAVFSELMGLKYSVVAGARHSLGEITELELHSFSQNGTKEHIEQEKLKAEKALLKAEALGEKVSGIDERLHTCIGKILALFPKVKSSDPKILALYKLEPFKIDAPDLVRFVRSRPAKENIMESVVAWNELVGKWHSETLDRINRHLKTKWEDKFDNLIRELEPQIN